MFIFTKNAQISLQLLITHQYFSEARQYIYGLFYSHFIAVISNENKTNVMHQWVMWRPELDMVIVPRFKTEAKFPRNDYFIINNNTSNL